MKKIEELFELFEIGIDLAQICLEAFPLVSAERNALLAGQKFAIGLVVLSDVDEGFVAELADAYESLGTFGKLLLNRDIKGEGVKVG